jgi:hypothetical protein
METGFKITGMEELKANLSALAKEEFPYAMALALTRTAQDIQTAAIEQMKRVFDRPTPWTLNSTYIVPAKKDNLTATVWLKDEWAVGKSGVPASKFLSPEIFGGQRNLKRHEMALQYAGILPAGMYCVPGQGADLDAYGNMKASQIIQIIAYFKAFGEQGYKANTTQERKDKLKKGTKKTRGYEYFAIRDRGSSRLKPGIYKRIGFGSFGSAIKPIIMFVKRPGYQPRLDFFGVANRVGDTMLKLNFDLALESALAKVK